MTQPAETNERGIETICRAFGIQGEYRSSEQVNNGHINTTYRVYFYRDGELKDYILQRVNTYVFQQPIQLMDNISSVTEYIRAKIKRTGVSAKRGVLHYQKTKAGKYYYVEPSGEFWRCCRYIDDSVTFDFTDNLKVIEESGRAFGEFQLYLSDYPVESLHIAIPHFHNTVMRYEAFRKAAEADAAGRAESVKAEIDECLSLEETATAVYKMQRRGELPLRVTHNDTKCNNVLFDKDTFEHLSVIDLDTVMPGLAAFDFGDAIRFTANTCAEDEEDVSKVALDVAKYEAFTRGFMTTVGCSLTDAEKKTMALGAVSMTAECGMRFLTDYLDGDKYFKIDYPTHNLVRCRCQFALARDMLRRLSEMQAIVEKYCGR